VSFFPSLNLGALGLTADFTQALSLATEFGYGGIDPDLGYLQTHDAAQVAGEVTGAGLAWGVAGLPVNLTADAATYAGQLAGLPALADTLAAAGVTRVGTWLNPSSDEVTYRRNFNRHADRIATVAELLSPAGIRLGLEYVGPKTSWEVGQYPFVHTLAETRELIAASGAGNVGVFLDTYHWYTAGESADDLRGLTNADVVGCDINDAPVGKDRREQIDLSRELPAATGVIDAAGFVAALTDIGYDGPVKVEPFNKAFAAQPVREAVEQARAAMKVVLGR